MFRRREEAPPPPEPRPGPLTTLFRLIIGLVALALPVAALWLVTSHALMWGLAQKVALGLGVSAVVLMPLLWDLMAEAQHRRKARPPERSYSRGDRIRLRILALSSAWILIAVFVFTGATRDALAQHGRWILFQADGPFARSAEGAIGELATQLDALDKSPPSRPARHPDARSTRRHEASQRWPWPERWHPVALESKASETHSIDAVVEKIAAQESGELGRLKAAHDFVLRWLSPDEEILRSGLRLRSEDAEGSFRRRRATSEGYARLLMALGEKLGLEMELVPGRVRQAQSDKGELGFWVGVWIGGEPQLVDPFANAVSRVGGEFRPHYATAYFLSPPEIFMLDHWPEDPRWLLREPEAALLSFDGPLSLNAHFFAWGMRWEGPSEDWLRAPNGPLRAVIHNPSRRWVLVVAQPVGGQAEAADAFNCVLPTDAPEIELNCELTLGTWRLDIYGNDQSEGRYRPLGSLR